MAVGCISGFWFLMTEYSCTHSDGSFYLDDSGARPSYFCRASGLFPHSHATAPGVLILVVAFCLPAWLVLAATAISIRRRRPVAPWVKPLAVVLAILSFIVPVELASIGYAGSG
ncbi:MAG: hypothetical protein QOC98_3355 [Frankiaceae bacterium]|nr:hypothetical protein [Frankiaceae bacterium]